MGTIKTKGFENSNARKLVKKGKKVGKKTKDTAKKLGFK